MPVNAEVYRKNMMQERDQRIRNEAYRKAAAIIRSVKTARRIRLTKDDYNTRMERLAEAIEAEITE